MKRAPKGRHKILWQFVLVSPLQGSLALDARTPGSRPGLFSAGPSGLDWRFATETN